MNSKQEETSKTGRLISLDAFRGLTIFGMISGSLGKELIAIPVLGIFFSQLHHSDWQGLTYYDLIFPAFLFIVGVAMPFSFAKRMSIGQSYNEIFLHAFKRFIIIFLLGSLRTSVDDNSPMVFELSSALQPIAFAYFISFLFLGKSIKFRAVISGIIIIIYWFILELVPASNIPAGIMEKNINIVTYFDNFLLGRSHSDGWGTLLLFFPQITNTLCGTIVGDLLRSKRTSSEKIKLMGIISGTCIIVGIIIAQFIPSIQKIWTPSYNILTIGLSCLLMLIFYWVIDIKGHWKWSFFFIVFGMNALALYMFNSLFGGQLSHIVNIFIKDLVEMTGPSVRILVRIFVKWLFFYWMYKREIFIKI